MSESGNIVTLAVEEGALKEALVYESHKRGKNWCAIIKKDPTAPGGIGRSFLQGAHGEFFYLVNGLEPNQALEFGADYYSGGGSRHTNRKYARVLSVTETAVTLEMHETAAKAIAAAKDSNTSMSVDITALRVERDQLENRLEEVNSILARYGN